jgi:hypothetical protein
MEHQQCKPLSTLVSSFGYRTNSLLTLCAILYEAQCLIGYVEIGGRIRNSSTTQPPKFMHEIQYPTSDIQQTMINSNTATLEKVKLGSGTGL